MTDSLGSSAAILVPRGVTVPEEQQWCTRQSLPSWIWRLLPPSCRSSTRLYTGLGGTAKLQAQLASFLRLAPVISNLSAGPWA